MPRAKHRGSDNAAAAREHYRREKARRARRPQPESELLAAAQREYRALLESDAAKGKGGRPRKTAAPAAPIKEDEAAEE